MTTGFGIDPVKNAQGVIVSGTSAADIRQITGALYTPGLISGGIVTTNASEMKYSVSAGVACVRIATGQNVLIPIPAVSSLPTTAPTAGTRYDYVYAQQLTPSTDGSSEVVVRVGTSVPSIRAVKLGQYLVSATNTNTNAAIALPGVDYSIPYGGSLGEIFKGVSAQTGVVAEPNNTDVYMTPGTITLPTDRRLQFTITVCSSVSDGSDGNINDWLEPQFSPQLDNVDQGRMIWRATGTWSVNQASFDSIATVSAGTHTVRVKRNVFSRSATRRLALHANPINSVVFTVTDLGVAI